MNSINMGGGHVALLSGPTVHSLYCDNILHTFITLLLISHVYKIITADLIAATLNRWFAFDVMAVMLEVQHKRICY